jgi:hypothetical protein
MVKWYGFQKHLDCKPSRPTKGALASLAGQPDYHPCGLELPAENGALFPVTGVPRAGLWAERYFVVVSWRRNVVGPLTLGQGHPSNRATDARVPLLLPSELFDRF